MTSLKKKRLHIRRDWKESEMQKKWRKNRISNWYVVVLSIDNCLIKAIMSWWHADVHTPNYQTKMIVFVFLYYLLTCSMFQKVPRMKRILEYFRLFVIIHQWSFNFLQWLKTKTIRIHQCIAFTRIEIDWTSLLSLCRHKHIP